MIIVLAEIGYTIMTGPTSQTIEPKTYVIILVSNTRTLCNFFLLCVLQELKVDLKLYFLSIDQTFFIAALLAMQYDKVLV